MRIDYGSGTQTLLDFLQGVQASGSNAAHSYQTTAFICVALCITPNLTYQIDTGEAVQNIVVVNESVVNGFLKVLTRNVDKRIGTVLKVELALQLALEYPLVMGNKQYPNPRFRGRRGQRKFFNKSVPTISRHKRARKFDEKDSDFLALVRQSVEKKLGTHNLDSLTGPGFFGFDQLKGALERKCIPVTVNMSQDPGDVFNKNTIGFIVQQGNPTAKNGTNGHYVGGAAMFSDSTSSNATDSDRAVQDQEYARSDRVQKTLVLIDSFRHNYVVRVDEKSFLSSLSKAADVRPGI
jgi:hypothetical protein